MQEISMIISEFRHRLDEATQGFPRKHIERIAALKNLYPHNIILHSNPNFLDSDDCFLYAFKNIIPNDLQKEFVDVVLENADQFEAICQRLVSEGFIALHDEQNISDRIVVYFDGTVAEHFGKIEKDEIISKWGKGYAWKHDLFEIPLSYGNTVKFSNGEIDIDVFRKVIEIYTFNNPE